MKAQLLGAEVGEAAFPSASSTPVEGSHSACYEFLWSPRAYVETSKWQVMAFLLRVNQSALREEKGA